MCTLPLFALLRQIAEPTPFLLPSPFPFPEISSFWGTSTTLTPSGTQEVLPTLAGRKYSAGSSLITSSSSMTLTYSPFYIAPLAVTPPLTFPLLPPLSALSCSWEVLHNLNSDHLPILLPVPLSPVFQSNKRHPSFNFQKTRWDDFAFYFDSHCSSAEE